MFNQETHVEVKEKLIILYTYAQFGLPVPQHMVNDMLLRLNVIDFFLLQQYTIELLEKGMLEKLESDQEVFISIKESGRDALHFFQDRLLTHYTTKINLAVTELKIELKRQRVVKADFVKVDESDYAVALQILDGQNNLIHIKLSVPTNRIAKRMCEQWREDATELYHKIIGLFELELTTDAQ